MTKINPNEPLGGDLNRICLGQWYPSDFAGCGQLRSYFPNNVLNSFYGQHRKKLYEGIASTRLVLPDRISNDLNFIRFQRQLSNPQTTFIDIVKRYRDASECANFKMIYDIDDLIGSVPKYNSSAKSYNTDECIANLHRIVNLVDIITVSTYQLKKHLKQLGGIAKIKIIPNYLPKYLYRPYEFQKTENEKPVIVWAGSTTHFNLHDKGDFAPIFDLMQNTVDEFRWVILGIPEIPIWLEHLKDKIELRPWVRSIYQYPTELKKINADFGVAPLVNNEFNNSKSNIKILDYASADIIAICSEITPYKESQLFFSGDWKTDRDTIIDIFQNKQKQEDILRAQSRMMDSYWLETKGIKKYRQLFEF